MEQQYFINVLQIIDAATERGTWKGGEIESISALRKMTMQKVKDQVESITKKIGEK